MHPSYAKITSHPQQPQQSQQQSHLISQNQQYYQNSNVYRQPQNDAFNYNNFTQSQTQANFRPQQQQYQSSQHPHQHQSSQHPHQSVQQPQQQHIPQHLQNSQAGQINQTAATQFQMRFNVPITGQNYPPTQSMSSQTMPTSKTNQPPRSNTAISQPTQIKAQQQINTQQPLLPAQPTSQQIVGGRQSQQSQVSSNIPSNSQQQASINVQSQQSQPSSQIQTTNHSLLQQQPDTESSYQPSTEIAPTNKATQYQDTSKSSVHSTLSNNPAPSIDTNVMQYGTKYEIKCDETFAYYEGYVVDYDVNDGSFQVMYDWKPAQHVQVNYVRPLAPRPEKSWKPAIGEHVECQAKAEESEPSGWWGCIVQAVKNNLYMIIYEGWDNHNDVMSLDILRPKNKHPNFSDKGLTREAKKLNKTQIEYVTNNREQLQRIATKTGLIHLGYRPDMDQLIFIGLKRQIDNASILMDHVWDLQTQYGQKEKYWNEEEQKLQSYYDKLSRCYRLVFTFDTELIWFVYGPQDQNYLDAKAIPGVEHINIKEINEKTSECLILASDREVAEEAREHLEVEMVTEKIPKSVLPTLLNNQGEIITKLEQNSKVSMICTLAHYNKRIKRDYSYQFDPTAEEVEMVIIGPKVNVSVAQLLLQSEVKTIAQRKQYVQRSQTARSQLQQYQQDDDGTKHYDEEFDNQNYDNQQGSYRRQYNKDQSNNQGQYDFNKNYKSSRNNTYNGKNKTEQYYENQENTNDVKNEEYQEEVQNDDHIDYDYNQYENEFEYDENEEFNPNYKQNFSNQDDGNEQEQQQEQQHQSYPYYQKTQGRSRGYNRRYPEKYHSPRTGNYQHSPTQQRKIYVKKQPAATSDTNQ